LISKKKFKSNDPNKDINDRSVPTVLEENSKAYRRLVPFDTMNPSIYAKDSEAYYGNERD